MIHPDGCECPLYGCELRRKGVRYSGSATPTARANRPFRPPVNCSWEAGAAGERRPDGSFMPYLDDRGRKIRVKQWGEERTKLEEIRRRQVVGPAPQE
jgi:hypothetical protein